MSFEGLPEMPIDDSRSASTTELRRSISSAALLALQPLAIFVTQVLWLYAKNVEEVYFGDIIRSLLLVGSAGLVVFSVAGVALRDARRGALFASLVAILFWSSTSILEFSGLVAATLLWVIGLPFAAWQLARRELRPLQRVFDWVAAGGLAIPLATIAFSGGASLLEASPLEPAPRSDHALRRPDIYLIVLDAHGRDDELAEHFGIEPGFGDQLETLGFYVARESRANYTSTLHSLSSLLNYDFVQKLVEKPTPSKLLLLIGRSRLKRILAAEGYQFISYISGVSTTQCRAADECIRPPDPLEFLGMTLIPNTFEVALLQWTPFGPALRRSERLSPYVAHRRRILHALDDLPRHASNPAPTFVFTHILSPHEPFVFGENGEDVSTYGRRYKLDRLYHDPDLPEEPGRVGPEYARRYRAQARYLHKEVLAAVEEILEKSSEPPIILIQGDHGPYGFSPNIRDARVAILNAYLLLGEEEALYPSISPVNSFRVILNAYFGRSLPLLPDKSYRTDSAKADAITPIVGD
jgi:hypothetical protein